MGHGPVDLGLQGRQSLGRGADHRPGQGGAGQLEQHVVIITGRCDSGNLRGRGLAICLLILRKASSSPQPLARYCFNAFSQ